VRRGRRLHGRTATALGAEALAHGNTLRRPACVHWIGRDVEEWLVQHRISGSQVIGVELVEIPMLGTGASLNVAVAARSCSTDWPACCDPIRSPLGRGRP
jgi:hypothetical protein